MALLKRLATNTKAAKSFRPVHDKFQSVRKDAAMIFLEKADNQHGGQVSLQDIGGALDEYQRLHKAGIASEAELLTLARAFPTNSTFQKAVRGIEPDAVMVVGGPASVEMIDREGHLITTAALSKAFEKYMDNFRTRNAMVLHSDVQVGWALPAYISKSGQIFKSGPSNNGLFFITEVRKDTKVADKVREQIDQGKLRSYSIAGSAIKVQNMQKGLMPYMQVDEMELAEVTVCEKGVNQGASFDILKAEELDQTGKISKEQCGYREATSAEQAMGIMCGTCEYFNEDKTCDVVVGKFDDTDYCNLFKPLNTDPDTIETTDEGESGGMAITIKLSEDGKPDYMTTFLSSLKKGKEGVDPKHLSDSPLLEEHSKTNDPEPDWEELFPGSEEKPNIPEEDIPAVNKDMLKSFTEWTTQSIQVQKDLEEDGSHMHISWGPQGLSKDSNIDALKNFTNNGG